VPVIIECPTCGANVRLRAEGFVDPHPGNRGQVCTFTRTAFSRGGSTKTAEERAEIARRAKEAINKRPAKTPAQPTEKTAAAKPKPKPARRECPRCGRRVGASAKTGDLAAHTRPDSARWCKGGAEPSDAQRHRAAPKRSVWTISGGLPTLGRRR